MLHRANLALKLGRSAGQPAPAFVFGMTIVINAALLLALRDRPLPAFVAGPRA